MSDLSILFCGDFAPVRRYQTMVPQLGAAIFGDLGALAEQADIAALNLEAPLSHLGAPINKGGPKNATGLRGHPDCAPIIAEAGFNFAGLANNHIMDQGAEALRDTMDACKSVGLAYGGAGMDIAEARQPCVIRANGQDVAIVAVAEYQFGMADADTPGAAPLDTIDVCRQLEEARRSAGLVILSIHGGNELFPLPRPGLRKSCQFFTERGADAVVCHHSHVPGAWEVHEGRPIFYGLGNLLFDHLKPPPGWCEGYAVRMTVKAESAGTPEFEIIPYTQTVQQKGIRLMRGSERDRFLETIGVLNETLADTERYADAWSRFCRERAPGLLARQYAPSLVRTASWLDRFISYERLLLPRNSINVRTNLLTCESHREALLEILLSRARRTGQRSTGD